MGSNPIPSAIYAAVSAAAFFYTERGDILVIFGRKIDVLHELKLMVGLLIGSMIYSFGLNLFLVPNNIIDGGVTGISLLLSELFGIPFSVLIVVLNIPFFILGYRQLGKRLAACSMFAILVLSFWSHIFEQMEPVTTDPFLSTIFGGILIGLGIGLVIKSGGSLDGTEIVAIYFDRRSAFSIGEIVSGIHNKTQLIFCFVNVRFKIIECYIVIIEIKCGHIALTIIIVFNHFFNFVAIFYFLYATIFEDISDLLFKICTAFITKIRVNVFSKESIDSIFIVFSKRIIEAFNCIKDFFIFFCKSF